MFIGFWKNMSPSYEGPKQRRKKSDGFYSVTIKQTLHTQLHKLLKACNKWRTYRVRPVLTIYHISRQCINCYVISSTPKTSYEKLNNNACQEMVDPLCKNKSHTSLGCIGCQTPFIRLKKKIFLIISKLLQSLMIFFSIKWSQWLNNCLLTKLSLSLFRGQWLISEINS